jgi:hypothetical protein
VATGDRPHDLRPALIELGGPEPDFERAVRQVETAGGRVLHAFPPHALIAELPHEVGGELVGRAGITRVSTEAVPPTRASPDTGPLGAIVEAWNRHLETVRGPERPLRGLPWDTPGLEPPDPPPEVMERLRRRERGPDNDPASDPEGDDDES